MANMESMFYAIILPMSSNTVNQFQGFSAEALASFAVAGISERWAAVQQQLHPILVSIAEQLQQNASNHLPQIWSIYETSYKDARWINRGPAGRDPIEEYHLAIDRPPRGSGMYVVVSAADRQILVAIQLWGSRKSALRQIWEESRTIWAPLIERMTVVRFADQPEKRKTKTESLTPPTNPASHPHNETTMPSGAWLDRYLASRNAAYLLAGFAYHWDDPQVAQPGFAERIIDDLLALLPLNEAIMEHSEQREPRGASVLREQSASYHIQPQLDLLVERIRTRGLALPATTIQAYHLALQTRPFAILPGISGTGKTRLTRLYADIIHGIAEGQPNERYLLIAVQPDWHNARDLLGYYNAITSKFHAAPLLRFMLRALGEPELPYFVCLDEMNLARPEYYLAPILSAMETNDRLIDLGAPLAEVETVTGELLQNPFRMPHNLIISGTVNIDESTHTLSDKLLDRANVIELNDIDLNAFRETWPGTIDPAIWQVISQIHAILARAGQPFGYRTLREILLYLEHAQGVLAAPQALDQQLKQKILPKLRGEDAPRLRRALHDLLELARGTNQSLAQQPAHLPESAEKLRQMLARLDTDGFTDFYG
jgi:hypothetical protein